VWLITFNCKLATPPKAGFFVMNVLRIEKGRSHPEVKGQSKSLGVFLDENDLRELSLRYEAAKFTAQPRTFANGALSFSRGYLAEKDILQTLINPLVDAGRARVVDRIPKGSFPGSGNTVIYLGEDDSVKESLSGVSDSILQHITQFFSKHPGVVNSAHIFPNTSTSGLKGLSIDLKPSKGLGCAINNMHWSMGRGLRVIALPENFNVDAFIDASDTILEHAFKIGLHTNGAIKSIQFFYDENQRVYMTIAAGPDRQQKRSINDAIANIHKPSGLSKIMEEVKELGLQERESITQAMLEYIPWEGSGVELVSDSPYVFVDTDMMTAFSGGVIGDTGELVPFSVGLDHLLIHQPEKKSVFPLGTKIADNSVSVIALPKNTMQKKIQSLVGLMPRESIESGLHNVTELSSLATGYHEKMIVQK